MSCDIDLDGGISIPAGTSDPKEDQALATISIAISLKRIADALCGTKEFIGIHESIFNISERRQA